MTDNNNQTSIRDLFPMQSLFNTSQFNVLLAEWIAFDNQPFTVIQSPFFLNMLCYLNPAVSLPSSVIIRNQLITNFNNNRSKLITRLKSVDSKISDSIDLWSSPNNLSFMGITGHFVDQEFKIHHILLDFVHVETNHSGENLARCLDQALGNLCIREKVLAVVTDNATNNITMMRQLEEIWVEFDYKRNHVRCMAYIMNLAIQSALTTLCCRPLADTTTESTTDATRNLRTPSCLTKLRQCIKTMKYSTQKMNLFLGLRNDCGAKILNPHWTCVLGGTRHSQ